MAPIVELEQITFRYPIESSGEPTLEDVTLRIEANDFLGIIGPNGGGKTTLLKIILGLLIPEQGEVRVFGKPPHAVRSRIGYVPQHSEIDSVVPASVLDIVLTGRLAHSSWGLWFGKSHVERAKQALQTVGLADCAMRSFGTLSGGQRQRVLIARALAADVELLLLDEPTSGIDSHVERGLTDLLHQLNKSLPIVLVSHDISFVSTHLRRVACLNRRLVCHSTADISSEIISSMYANPIRMVQHESTCSLSDSGCTHGCSLQPLSQKQQSPKPTESEESSP